MGNNDSEPKQEDNKEDETSAKIDENNYKEETIVARSKPKFVRDVAKAVVSVSSADISEVKMTVQQYIERLDHGSVRCTICGKVNTGRDGKKNLENHIETHLEGLSFPCQLCGKTFRSQNAFNVHKSRSHR